MKSMQFAEYGAPDVLHVVDVDEASRWPRANPGGGTGGRHQPYRLEDPQRRHAADDASRVAEHPWR
jgi:hypothetical protein